MNENKSEFQLRFNAEINKKSFEVTLFLRKSDSSGMYFFNNYQASLERNNGEKTAQTFYLNRWEHLFSSSMIHIIGFLDTTLVFKSNCIPLNVI